MSRAQILAERIDAFADTHVSAFGVGLAVLFALFSGALSLAVWAVSSGPVGPELLDDVAALGLSRLSVLQLSLFTALIVGLVLIGLIACWRNAPGWLRLAAFSAVILRVLRRLGEGSNPGSAKHYALVVGGVAAIVNVAMLWDLPVVACLEPDTVGYLEPSMIRSAGYMVFLDVVVALAGDLRWVYPLQLNLMLAGFAVLGWSVRAHLGSWWAGVIVAIAPMLSAGLLILTPAIMTEAVFVALICFHLAAVLWALRSPGWAALILAGTSVGLMIVLRPNGLSFVLSLAFLLYVLRAQWGRIVVGFGVPVLALLLLQGAYNQAAFGFFGLHQFGGVSLVGNFSPLIRADMGGEHPDLNAKLVTALDRYSHFPDFEDRSFPYEMAEIAALTAAGSIYKVILPEIRQKLDIPQPTAVAFERDPRVNAIAGDLSRAAILNDPWGAFQIVTSNFIGNWHLTLPVRVPMSIYFPRCVDMSLDLARKHPDMVAAHTDVEFYQSARITQAMNAVRADGLRWIEAPRLVISALQKPLGYVALAIAIFGFVAGLMQGPKASRGLQVTSLGALSLMAGYGVISLGNTAFTRYSVVFDPVVFLMFAGAFVFAWRWMAQDEN